MEDAIEVTVLRHAVMAPSRERVYVESEDYVTESNFFYSTTKSNNNNCNNYSTCNATISEDRSYETLMIYALPVILIMGTVGNSLSFLVLLRCQMRNTSVYFYLLALAVADTCYLYFSALKTWIRLISGYELLHESDGFCKGINFFVLVWQHISAWLIVLVTVDRFVVVWFPFKATSFCTVTRSRIATAALTTTVVACNSHVFWTYHLYYHEQKRMLICGPPSSMYFMFREFEFLKLATYSFIPFVIIIVLNIAIITRLHWQPFLFRGRSSAETTSTFSGTSRTESAAYGRQAKVTYMLITVSFAWLVFTLPNAIHALIFGGRWEKAHKMYRAVSFLLMYTNHAINFYLYCITGKKFRRELEDLSRTSCSRTTKPNNGSTFCSPSRKTHGPRTNLVDIELHELVNT